MFRKNMAVIEPRPTLQRKCFTCTTWMCCLVTVKHCFLKYVLSKVIEIFDWLDSCSESQWLSCSFTVGPLYCVDPVCGCGVVVLCAICFGEDNVCHRKVTLFLISLCRKRFHSFWSSIDVTKYRSIWFWNLNNKAILQKQKPIYTERVIIYYVHISSWLR
jgi:hypothetical protein